MNPDTNQVANFVGSIISAFIGAGVATVFINHWLENRRIKRIKTQEAIETVVDLLSEWVKPSYTGDHSDGAHWKLQNIYWKTILRLDKKILDILIPLFSYSKKNLTTSEVLVKCRQILLGLKKPDLKPEELNKWLPEKKNKS